VFRIHLDIGLKSLLHIMKSCHIFLFSLAQIYVRGGFFDTYYIYIHSIVFQVIEHKPYDRKADIFSFGIVLWELLTGKIPYDSLTPLQAAVGVVQKGLRPTIPSTTPPKLAELLEHCWATDPVERPDFSVITTTLQEIVKEVLLNLALGFTSM
jgi:serine/threonine protein kinase